MKNRMGLILLTGSLLLSGCITYKPNFDPNAAYFERLETQTQDGLSVSVVGLSAKETKKTFGVNLASKNILPVWIKIENQNQDHAYLFLERSVDPEYYTSSEAAYMTQFHPGYRLKKILPPVLHFVTFIFLPFEDLLAGKANQNLQKRFEEQTLNYGWVKPGESRSGFIFVPFKVGTKQISVDLFRDDIKSGHAVKKNFEYFIEIPGIKQDYLAKDFTSLYPADQITDIQDEETLKKTLEALPCCTTNKNGTKNGDPVNLIVIGNQKDVLASFTAGDWDETEIVSLSSVWKMIQSFSFKKKYDYSPVSPLFLYGRGQDVAFQKARLTINERMHLRLWDSPLRYKGKTVWVGSVSRDIGVRFTNKTWNLMTHKIDPDIDEAAIYTLSDMIYKNRIAEYGVFGGVPVSSPDNPARNMTGDPYYTSGIRSVLVLAETRNPEFPARLGVQTPSGNSPT